MSTQAHDAIQSLARITQASSRLAALIALRGYVADPEEEIDHMKANLDSLARLMQP